MRVLVGCECSGVVREAFRARGHDAWSCDLLPAEDGSPFHLHGDVLAHLGGGWDLGIFHPPCQYIANSGARWLFEKPGRWAHLYEAVQFFRALLQSPIPRVAVENSQPHKWGQEMIGRKYDQKVQPWWFGDKQKKGLCLWLRGLPPLVPDCNVGPLRQAAPRRRKRGSRSGVWRQDRSRPLTALAPSLALRGRWQSSGDRYTAGLDKPGT